MTIFHFCNDTFGTPFPAVSANFAKQHRLRIVRVLGVTPKPANLATVSGALRREGGLRLRRAQRRLAGAPSHGDDLPTLFVSDVNAPSFRKHIRPGDVGVITGFNQIFGPETIAKFDSFVNLHPSILPLYRGPVPTYWCIHNQEALSGFTLHKVVPKIDAGEPIYQEVVPIEGVSDVLGLELKIGNAALPTFLRYLEHLRTGNAWEVKLVDAFSVYKTHLNYATFPELHSGHH
ncbi:MAG TPA: formyltransferase family protein [Candidatus Acidoferrales bacterium]|nr:formyltransferase family protein [Candidatus Acidoferrales bacterium]